MDWIHPGGVGGTGWEQRAAGVCRRGASFEFCYLSPEAFRLSAERAVETPFLVQGAPSLHHHPNATTLLVQARWALVPKNLLLEYTPRSRGK